ncbi:hypothetical protein COW20_20395 [bacterium (Candidatus Blackallbacteria) CG13_big_fil_rev_8_21_14_2_50_49_14]|nr:MAG: hypothetical protein COW20_20395 [bacterium (Candidatus Blackallbacteria) CG13_big_fil_rev_8_21_14_2_50_49_14]
MSDFKISVGGNPLENYQIRQIKNDKTMMQVEQHLKENPDGYDSMGVKIDGQDYLIVGKGLKANAGDSVEIEGQAMGRVEFVEEENNTFAEGLKAGFKTKMAGLEHSVAGGPLVLGAAAVKGTAAAIRGAKAHEKEIEAVTEGPPLTRQLIEDAVKAISSMFGGGDED